MQVVLFQEYASYDAAGLLENALKRIHVINMILDEDFKSALQIEHLPPPPPPPPPSIYQIVLFLT